jgi:hypothetical protein
MTDASHLSPIEKERRIAYLEETIAERDQSIARLTQELRIAQGRHQSFPDNMYSMERFLRDAPSFWHLHTMVGLIVRRLVRSVSVGRSESEVSAAYGALAQIAIMLRTAPQKRAAAWLRKALVQPAFLKIWNTQQPRRTRGGSGGNGSIQIVFTFVEMAMLAYDKHVEAHYFQLAVGGLSRPERYSRHDEYLQGFLPFAKELWEDGGWKNAESLWKHEGYKLRTNNSNPSKPKRSFGLFKDDIQKQARRNLENWRSAWPPYLKSTRVPHE